uniref:Uncharacterized protein n=1 Tax=Daphnia galeata TaxID=27404 RepID=A0A8J2RG12_9CRUS|nr:unnamed protein product [Daphnia galeata]
MSYSVRFWTGGPEEHLLLMDNWMRRSGSRSRIIKFELGLRPLKQSGIVLPCGTTPAFRSLLVDQYQQINTFRSVPLLHKVSDSRGFVLIQTNTTPIGINCSSSKHFGSESDRSCAHRAALVLSLPPPTASGKLLLSYITMV